MQRYQVILTIKQAIHPITEVVQATDTNHAEQVVRQMCKDAGVAIKQIVSIIQIN